MEGDELQPRGLQRQAQGARAVEEEVVGELEAFGPGDGGQPARVDLCEVAGLDEEHSIGCQPAPLRRQLGDGLAQVGQHVAVGDHVEALGLRFPQRGMAGDRDVVGDEAPLSG